MTPGFKPFTIIILITIIITITIILIKKRPAKVKGMRWLGS